MGKLFDVLTDVENKRYDSILEVSQEHEQDDADRDHKHARRDTPPPEEHEERGKREEDDSSKGDGGEHKRRRDDDLSDEDRGRYDKRYTRERQDGYDRDRDNNYDRDRRPRYSPFPFSFLFPYISLYFLIFPCISFYFLLKNGKE